MAEPSLEGKPRTTSRLPIHETKGDTMSKKAKTAPVSGEVAAGLEGATMRASGELLAGTVEERLVRVDARLATLDHKIEQLIEVNRSQAHRIAELESALAYTRGRLNV